MSLKSGQIKEGKIEQNQEKYKRKNYFRESSYRLSATKHPLNNLVINPSGRLRRPLSFSEYSPPFTSIFVHPSDFPLSFSHDLPSFLPPLFTPITPFFQEHTYPLSVRSLPFFRLLLASDDITHAPPSLSLSPPLSTRKKVLEQVTLPVQLTTSDYCGPKINSLDFTPRPSYISRGYIGCLEAGAIHESIPFCYRHLRLTKPPSRIYL